MSTRTRYRMLGLTGLLAIALALAASPALAAPALEVSLTPNPTTLPRTDERMEFQATVTNTASLSAGVGDTLLCNGIEPQKGWFPNSPNPEPTFAFAWTRDGVVIPGAISQTYLLTAPDAGASIQCLVTGTNVNASATFAALPSIVVSPQPATAPPNPPLGGQIASQSRPEITDTGGTSRTGLETGVCKTSALNWTGTPTFTYQWLLNAVPIPGATTSEYTPVAADEGKILQCKVVGTNAGGGLVGISNNNAVGTVPFPPNLGVTATAAVETTNSTSGQVSLDFDLPSGEETVVASVTGTGWACATQQPEGVNGGHVTCTRSTPVLSPGASYPPVSVVVNLGADAPAPSGTATAVVSGGGSAPDTDDATYTFTEGIPFGAILDSFEAAVFDEAGDPHTKAGGHPFQAYTTFGFNAHRNLLDQVVPTESIRDVVVDAPRGFVGNALSTPTLCDSVESVLLALCPPDSVVGGIDVYTVPDAPRTHNIYPDDLHPLFANTLIYSIEPEYGQPAQFAFGPGGEGISRVPYTFVPELRADEGYAVSFRTAPIVTSPPLWGSTVNLCNFGGKVAGSGQTAKFAGCREATDPDAYPNPLITNPTRCSGPPPTSSLKIDSWQHPQDVKTYNFTADPITDCDEVDFEPEAELQPTNTEADSPTGLNVEITMPIDGVLSPAGVSQANLNTATVTLPKGMSINPAASDGLQACSLAQIKLKSNAEDECPEASKVGSVEIDTPLIRETLTGDVYVARQKDNPFDSTLGLYMAFDSKRDGVRIKVAGRLITDPVTGQLTSEFTENPEAPFSRLALKFNGGPRAALINPPTCGTYAIRSEFSPWSAVSPANPTPDEIVVNDSTYQVTSGPGGSPCPEQKLEPKLKAGLRSIQAGSKSPFVFTLSRDDGTQRFTGLKVGTPEGLTAYLRGIPYCPDAVLAGIPTAEQTGAAELASPACPAASQVGTSQAGAGAGPYPFYAPGKVYLAGPYKGAPVSLAVITPAVAGPFDLGNVVIRNPLFIDPVTSAVTTTSDPIPTILHGILLDIRDIRVALDRPSFTAAPTDCDAKQINATVSGELGASADTSSRFQVGGCEALGFKPTLHMRLFGGTRRGAHPKLRAILKPRAGDANIATGSVALPHSEFLDQAHIRTVCTRVQFAADACPQGAIYGHAEAITPLLDAPVSGPVYLRSSDNQLPDLVASLRGPDHQPIEVVVSGRIDSVNGGIRSTFDFVPDQPVSSFTLTMQGGQKGLLVNSRDLCKGKPQRATVEFAGQNGKTATLRPLMRNSCGKRVRKGKQGAKKGAKGGKRRGVR